MLEHEEKEMVTPGDVLGKSSALKAGKGAYVVPQSDVVFASLTGFRHIIHPPHDSVDQRPTVEVIGCKDYGVFPEPGSTVFARITKVMARMASADIICVGRKAVREKFSGIIRTPKLCELVEHFYPCKPLPYVDNPRQQDVRANEIDKVDMHASFRPGDIIRASVVSYLFDQLSLGDARSYYLSTAKNELGVVSAESSAGVSMVPISWTEIQCPVTGQSEQRKIAPGWILMEKKQT